MKIATMLSYAGGFQQSIAEIVEMERAGLDVVWVPEAYGFDSASLMGYLAALTEHVEIGAAIWPVYTRTPTLIAMTAAGLDALSNGRFHLGLGASGPQVIEGFHGVPYRDPLGRTREVVEICREVWRRDAPLVHRGPHFTIPLAPEDGTGWAKSLKLITHPVRDDIPIWIAALGERNVRLAAEVADGWMPMLFIPELAPRVWGDALAEGARQRSPARAPLMVTAGGPLAIGEGDDVTALREHQRATIALYVGGMGARGKNFYHDLAVRYGFAQQADLIQELYLSGRRREAEAAVPADLLELTSLCGPRGYVAERIAAFAQAGVTHLQVQPLPQPGRSAASLIDEVRSLM